MVRGVRRSKPARPQSFRRGEANSRVCSGVPTLLITKFSDSPAKTQAAFVEALGDRAAFLYTAYRVRPDGSYVVERRGADSAGHRKVFDGFDALVDLYAALPTAFTVEDLTRPGLTDGRRHLVLRHVVEHPAFDCELASRQPLRARKEME